MDMIQTGSAISFRSQPVPVISVRLDPETRNVEPTLFQRRVNVSDVDLALKQRWNTIRRDF